MSLWHPKVVVKIRMLTLRLMIERLWNISKTCWYQFLLSLSLSKIMHSWCRMHQVVHQDVFREEKHTYWWTFRWDSARSRRRQQQQQETKFHYKKQPSSMHYGSYYCEFWLWTLEPMSLNWKFQAARNLACLLLLFSFYLVCHPKDPPPQTTDSGYHYHHHHQQAARKLELGA